MSRSPLLHPVEPAPLSHRERAAADLAGDGLESLLTGTVHAVLAVVETFRPEVTR